jgi:protein SCO1
MSMQSEEQFAVLVDELVVDPNRVEQLTELLREDHSFYDQHGAATVMRMRGWILLALARIEVPDAALPFVLEELDTGVDAYLVAAAACALRSYPNQDPAFAPFVVRAISNIRYRDEPVSFQRYGGYAIGPSHTSPLRELLATLTWLGPHARAVAAEVEQLRASPTALGMKLQVNVDQALAAMRTDPLIEPGATDCCSLPNGVRGLFSWMPKIRTSTAPIESVDFEDQDGCSVTFGQYFRGQPSIVVFFYTRCDNPLKCSLTISKLARIQKLLRAEGLGEQINTAGITYDPGFDLAERIRKYGEHRGVEFAERHRMLRTRAGIEPLCRHFKLGVNFIESLVNRHRLEVYVLDAEARIAAHFERVQWNEKEVVECAREVLTETLDAGNSAIPGQPGRYIASPVFGTVIALGLALFPKCPLCWAAYLSVFGIAGLGSIPYSPWLQPVLALLMLFNLTSIWLRARTTRRVMPFYLVSAGAAAILASKTFASFDAAANVGIAFTLVGSLWSAIGATNRRAASSFKNPNSQHPIPDIQHL